MDDFPIVPRPVRGNQDGFGLKAVGRRCPRCSKWARLPYLNERARTELLFQAIWVALVWSFEFGKFEFVSNFVLRIQDLSSR
jgi:hypothetical protein